MAKAICCCRGTGLGTHGFVLYGDKAVEIDVAGVGSRDLSDIGICQCPEGIWVWEGEYEAHYLNPLDGGGIDGYYPTQGTFRLLTKEEWACVQMNENPFEER